MACRVSRAIRSLRCRYIPADRRGRLSIIIFGFGYLVLLGGGSPHPYVTTLTVSLSAGMLMRIPAAEEILQEERTRTLAEQDAIEDFYTRIARIEAQNPSTEQPSSPHLAKQTILDKKAQSGPVKTDPLETVGEAYRGTIMAVDHYDEEYAEPFEVSFANEFGPELLQLLASSVTLHPELKQTLLDNIEAAKTRRKRFAHAIQREVDLLETSEEHLNRLSPRITSIQDSLGAGRTNLRDDWDELCSLEDDCQSLLYQRQKHIQSRYKGIEFLELLHYLYQDREWTFPVLNDTLNLYADIQTTKRRFTQRIQRIA